MRRGRACIRCNKYFARMGLRRSQRPRARRLLLPNGAASARFEESGWLQLRVEVSNLSALSRVQGAEFRPVPRQAETAGCVSAHTSGGRLPGAGDWRLSRWCLGHLGKCSRFNACSHGNHDASFDVHWLEQRGSDRRHRCNRVLLRNVQQLIAAQANRVAT